MMAPTSFKSIYLEESGQLSIRKVDEAYIPTGSQSLVAVKYSGVCPGDLRHFYMGWNSYNLGYEFIGTVETIGPESPYRVGEMVFGHAKFGHRRPNYLGSHQDYLIADTLGTFRVPRDMLLTGSSDSERKKAWTQVVSWPAAILTASDMLFNCLDFSFPDVPGLEKGANPKGRAILIWGGAGAVGLATIQIAKAAGFSPIYTIASPHNHAALLELGATKAFDYRSPGVVDEIHAAVAASGKELSVIADAVTTGTGCGEPPSSAPRDVSKSSPFMAKQTLTKGATDVRLVATLIVDFDPDWKFCVSIRDADMFPDAGEYRARTQAALEWLLENHNEIRFRIPNVRVVKGAEEGIKAIYDVYEGKVSMEKVVIEHPM